jgi:putative SOS response-associated peptidase YedK
MLLQNGKAHRPVTNVRDDTILKSSFWKSSFVECRCLVPATSFCEPHGDVKPPHGNSSRSRVKIPQGIWRRDKGPVKKDGPNVDIQTYAFLTTTTNLFVARINHERMSVLLTREEEFETWLMGPPENELSIAQAYPPDRMMTLPA